LIINTGLSASQGTGLNIRVIGGTAEPSTTKENVIWVNTESEITSWGFGPSEPESPVEGVVWFRTGNSGPVGFDILKTNSVIVYPSCAHQYVAGEWVEVEVKIYQDGGWVDFPTEIFYLLKDGNQYIDITGGWTGIDSAATVLSKSGEDTTPQAGCPVYLNTCTINKIDMTDYNLMSVQVDALDANIQIRLLEESGYIDTYIATSESFAGAGIATLNLQDISGSYCIGFWIEGTYHSTSSATASFTISEVKLEK
jgi:hypothetical protein